MCGIVGIVGPNGSDVLLQRMRDTLRHRGPDDEGLWVDAERHVRLGHRRLAILDLSAAGHQPMASASGRYVIVFNGEVFNFRSLTDELSRHGHTFRGHSDTEVMLAAIEQWGVRDALERFVGMFAFAIWDRHEQRLSLARDRIGIKPLYYAVCEREMAFASEMTALRAVPWLDDALDHEALHDYFRYLCVPAPRTILRSVSKLEPGTLVTWSRNAGIHVERYWDLKSVAHRGLQSPARLSLDEAASELEQRMLDSVQLRMQSDVPYGAFLSGGLDSSLLVALMSRVSSAPVDTFTIGFDESSHDESARAAEIARMLGTRHHEQRIVAAEVPALVKRVSKFYDEPFADGSSIPTYLLCRFARQHVTVALAGDGGDELYGGYPRYYWAQRIATLRRMLGARGARWVAHALHGLPDASADHLLPSFLQRRFAGAHGLHARVTRFAQYLSNGPENTDRNVISAWSDTDTLLNVANGRVANRHAEWNELQWPEQMMAIDQQHYLPDDILTKVDRASMAVSMEVRVPYLDHRLVEWSWSLPRRLKLPRTGDRGKLVMRKLLYRYLPRKLVDHPKKGLGLPMAAWLRGPLKPWAEERLEATRIERTGFLRAEPIRAAWSAHLRGEDRLPQLWTVLMLLQWLDNWANREN